MGWASVLIFRLPFAFIRSFLKQSHGRWLVVFVYDGIESKMAYEKKAKEKREKGGSRMGMDGGRPAPSFIWGLQRGNEYNHVHDVSM